MRIRLLAAAACILAVPICFSASKSSKLMRSLPFATVAFAGHTIDGNFCSPCGTATCFCDATGQSAKPVGDPSPAERGGKVKKVYAADLDLGTGALLFALALFVWSRMRA